MLREATADELTRWDELIVANPDGGNVLQSRAFGDVKAQYGWQSKYMMFGGIAFLALVRHCPLQLGDLWYIPKGPGFTNLNQLSKLAAEIKKTGAFMIKIDPEVLASKAIGTKLSAMGFTKVRDIQYNTSTIIADLSLTEEDILASFKQKTRYNVNLALRKGVTVMPVEVTAESVDQLYQMAKTTYERAGVYVREKSYFACFWKIHAQQGRGQMFFAKFDGQLIAGAFITHLGEKALYKDGASYREHSNLQAPYLLQWEIMKWLKLRGVTSYDLHGVPPADQMDNPKHPLAGLARFKTGFNPEVVEYIGTYDYACHRASYAAWGAIGERIVMSYESRANKRLFY